MVEHVQRRTPRIDAEVLGQIAERAAQAAQRKVEQALAVFASADVQSGDSMLRPLRLLALANLGGATLRVSQGWLFI